MRIRKGDRVVVLQGKARGKQGLVTRVLPADRTIIVEGVNIATKHQKKRHETVPLAIIDNDMPIPVSNVAVVSPSDGKPTRVGYRLDDNGNKIRICKRTGADL